MVYSMIMCRQSLALCVIGTRPEAIKMAPIVAELRQKGIQTPILATAQHRQLLDQVLDTFHLKSEWDLNAMRSNQSLSELVARILPEIDMIIQKCHARIVIAQGDTTTVFAAALAAFHAGVPFAHVEAGLRSGNLHAPFPEEGNRRLVSVLSRFHFAPTETSRQALLKEGFKDNTIHVVGNTVIDSLLAMASRQDLPWPEGVPTLGNHEKLVLITLHRRENFGEPFNKILGALRTFAQNHPDTHFVYPVHPNPNIQTPAQSFLGGLSNIHLLDPIDYPCLVSLLKRSYAVFTDSGGLQEEAPALGKPVIVFRDVTERPEAVEAGGVVLVGSDPERFAREASNLWENPVHYHAMAQPRFPYGDGKTGSRIAEILENYMTSK